MVILQSRFKKMQFLTEMQGISENSGIFIANLKIKLKVSTKLGLDRLSVNFLSGVKV